MAAAHAVQFEMVQRSRKCILVGECWTLVWVVLPFCPVKVAEIIYNDTMSKAIGIPRLMIVLAHAKDVVTAVTVEHILDQLIRKCNMGVAFEIITVAKWAT